MRNLLIIPALALASCAPTLSPAASAIEVAQGAPDGCERSGTFSGSSNVNSMIGDTKERAEGEALEKAAAAGTTHGVWADSKEGVFGGLAVLDGYKCSQP